MHERSTSALPVCPICMHRIVTSHHITHLWLASSKTFHTFCFHSVAMFKIHTTKATIELKQRMQIQWNFNIFALVRCVSVMLSILVYCIADSFFFSVLFHHHSLFSLSSIRWQSNYRTECGQWMPLNLDPYLLERMCKCVWVLKDFICQNLIRIRPLKLCTFELDFNVSLVCRLWRMSHQKSAKGEIKKL